MTELKTLKDLENRPKENSTTQYKPYVYSETLKAEAVKHFKQGLKEIGDGDRKKHPHKYGALIWIKHFFNLKEEDLKN
jgi:hypothetical protein